MRMEAYLIRYGRLMLGLIAIGAFALALAVIFGSGFACLGLNTTGALIGLGIASVAVGGHGRWRVASALNRLRHRAAESRNGPPL